MRLGERLVRDGLISENQLRTALHEQKRTEAPLGQVLITLGFLQEEVLAEILAQEQGVPFIRLGEIAPDPELLRSVTPDFARKHAFFPVKRQGSRVVVAFGRPMDILSIDAVKHHLWKQLEVVAAAPRDIHGAISRYLDSISGRNGDAPAAVVTPRAEGESRPGDDAVTVTSRLLDQGLRWMATDIHIEPEEQLVRVRYRIDGILEQGENLPVELGPGVIARIKILSGLDITERRLPQDGRLSVQRGDSKVDMRVSLMPTHHGENVVLRVLDKSAVSLNLRDMGISGPGCDQLRSVLSRPNGMVLVSGPTGSGKSTTLYALLKSLDALTLKIVTVEDPIEYEQPLIRQSQVEPSIGYTFAAGLRTILRQDPDVILVGEVRDGETADTALKASLTGHLVLSSIHTNSAVGVVSRLLDLGVDRYLVASSLSATTAQRLVRRICEHCKEHRPASPTEARVLGIDDPALVLCSGRGCKACRGTGYAGRLAIFEVFLVDDEVARIVAEGGAEHDLQARHRAVGSGTIVDDAVAKVLAGLTTVTELQRVCPTVTSGRPAVPVGA